MQPHGPYTHMGLCAGGHLISLDCEPFYALGAFHTNHRRGLDVLLTIPDDPIALGARTKVRGSSAPVSTLSLKPPPRWETQHNEGTARELVLWRSRYGQKNVPPQGLLYRLWDFMGFGRA